MISVRPTGLAKFQEVRKEQAERGEDDMRLAIDVANRAVRRAHGSTAITNLPALVRSGGPMHSWLTTLFGFFGTMLQRRVEIMHQLNDVYKLGQAGEIKNAAGAIPSMVTNFMVYYVWPTIVEEYVTGLTTDDRRGWGSHLFFGAMTGLGSSFIYIRDIVHSLVTGHEPGVGLISSPLHDASRLMRDVRQGKKMFNREHIGNLVGDSLTVFG